LHIGGQVDQRNLGRRERKVENLSKILCRDREARFQFLEYSHMYLCT
jgi:hypothetical protein